MKRLEACLSLLVCLALSTPLLAATRIGQVVGLQGSATAESAEGAARTLVLKSPVFAQDTIKTGGGTRVQMMFEDDSIVAVGENSQMVLDKYVYDPGAPRGSSCSMKMVKGLFRVVTGKVAEAAPDRFSVRTSRAIIGIRGCDLGFLVGDERDDVYIIRLPVGKRILVEKSLIEEAVFPSLTILEAGVAVAVQAGLALNQRPVTAAELKQLIDGSSPGGDSDGGQESFQPAPVDPTGDAQLGTGDPGGDQMAEAGALTSTVELGGGGTNEFAATSTARPSLSDRPPQDEPGQQFPPLPAPPTEPPPPPPQIDMPLPPPLLAAGFGSDFDHGWVWGIWADGLVDYGGGFISAGDVERLIAGSVLYNLNGSGTAGALLHHGGTMNLVQGTCTLNVSIGRSTLPKWNGSFNLANGGGDRLTFSTTGEIDDGVLVGRRTSYSMGVNGANFDGTSITGERIDGRLTGPGTGARPITGATGDFRFEHGRQATVEGAFGADL